VRLRLQQTAGVTFAAVLALAACSSSAGKGSSAAKPAIAARPAATPTTQPTAIGLRTNADEKSERIPDKPLTSAQRRTLADQLVIARAVAMRYPTVADATAAGYHLVGGGFGPGSGAHYIGGSFSLNFDPSHPLALIYDGIHPTSQVVGVMYYGMGETAPQGFAGPNDHWHRHSGVCIGSGGAVLFPPDSDVTARKCAIARGSFMAVTGWMVHAWVVPGWESPEGVFSHENPDLRCADGTFHTDAIGRCQGS